VKNCHYIKENIFSQLEMMVVHPDFVWGLRSSLPHDKDSNYSTEESESDDGRAVLWSIDQRQEEGGCYFR
jgi:hypothetical protein